MPLLSKEYLNSVGRHALTRNATYADRIVSHAKTRLHGQLARTQNQNAANENRLKEIVEAAEKHSAALQKQLPELSRLADSAVGEQRSFYHRNYLQAIQNIQRCAQIRDAATRELIVANHQ